MTETRAPARGLQRSEIALDDCWAHLHRESFGRLAVSTSAGPDIFPVNYTVHERALYFRTASGKKLIDLSQHSAVAFEVDGRLAGMHWSVVVRGEALRLNSDAEIEASGVLSLHTATPTAKWNYVRLEPHSVTGRHFSLLDELSPPA